MCCEKYGVLGTHIFDGEENTPMSVAIQSQVLLNEHKLRCWGLLHGISICWDMGFKKIICYSDSQYVIDLINKGNQDFHLVGSR